MIYINEGRLKHFRLNMTNFYVVMDFDMTITIPGSDNSWSILENPDFVDPCLKKEARTLFKQYYTYENDYNLDKYMKTKYMVEWYQKNMDLFFKYNLTYDALINCVQNSNVSFRNNAKDFLGFLYKNNIPVIIVSAGIGNVIYEFLKFNNCLYDNIFIISNFLDFENNKVLPFNKEMIHSCNKSIRKLPENFYKKIRDRIYILLFGDLIEDLNMVPTNLRENTLSFGFLERQIDDNLKFYLDAFDVVLTDNSSFSDIQKIITID